jgi:hypothetical protein
MWQPNRAQWSIIWTVAVLLVLAWPPDAGRSLGVKAVNWAVDPAGSGPEHSQPFDVNFDTRAIALTGDAI